MPFWRRGADQPAEPDREPEPARPVDRAALDRLRAQVEALGGDGAVVSLEAYFGGHVDEAALGCNLGDDHPGIDAFERVLRAVRDRPDVADVVVEITEADPSGDDDDDWPYTNSIYVITTADGAAVHEWTAALHPDGWDERYGNDPWAETTPPGAPTVPDGYRVVLLFWD